MLWILIHLLVTQTMHLQITRTHETHTHTERIYKITRFSYLNPFMHISSVSTHKMNLWSVSLWHFANCNIILTYWQSICMPIVYGKCILHMELIFLQFEKFAYDCTVVRVDILRKNPKWNLLARAYLPLTPHRIASHRTCIINMIIELQF